MNITQKFLTATALGVALTGCSSMGGMGLPQYGSIDAGTRMQNTQVSPSGIRYHGDGTPVRVHYNACQMLDREIRNTSSSNATQRAINQGTGSVAGAISRRNGSAKDAILGALGGVAVGIVGDQAARAVNSPRIASLEADCNQQRAAEQHERNLRSQPRYR